MSKVLVVVDMQNDFIDGSLGSDAAKQIIPNVVEKIKKRKSEGYEIILTMDTHGSDYFTTREGKFLPVVHCVKQTYGHKLNAEIAEITKGCRIYEKNSYGSLKLIEDLAKTNPEVCEFIGLCTDICVISNVMGLKAFLPEAEIVVDSSCCAGSTEEGHNAALLVMKSCNVTVI